MRKTFLAITLFLAFSKAALAQFGNCTASEMRTYVDSATGNTITMLTDTMKNDRFLYQTDPMWTADGKYLLFRSSSRGNDKEVESTLPNGEKRKWTPTQIYFIEMATGKIIQATEGPNLGSAFLANKTNRMFVSRKEKENWNMYVMDLNKFFADVKQGKVGKPSAYETFIGTFPTEMGRPGGYAVDCNDDYAYITVEREGTEEEKERMMKNAFLPESNQPVKIKPTLCITPEKVRILQDADDIYIRGLREYKVKLSGEEARRVLAAGVPADMQNGEIEVSLYDQIWQAGTVLLSTVRSVGVMGDERTYEHPVALRAVTSTDAMTADWAHLPYDFMAKVSNEIINKVKGVNRVCYDISSKPPSTIEWE